MFERFLKLNFDHSNRTEVAINDNSDKLTIGIEDEMITEEIEINKGQIRELGKKKMIGLRRKIKIFRSLWEILNC